MRASSLPSKPMAWTHSSAAVFKTTKFIVFIVATVGVLLAFYLVKASHR